MKQLSTCATAVLILWASFAGAAPAKVSKPAAPAGAPPAAPIWAAEPDRVMGVILGAVLDDAGLPPCPKKWTMATAICIEEFRWPDPNTGPLKYSLHGHGFSYITTSVVTEGPGGVVTQLDVGMQQENFSRFVEVLNAKYGPPTDTVRDVFQTKAGATYQNVSLIWLGQHMKIVATQQEERLGRSFVHFIDLAGLERSNAKAREAATDAAKGL